MNRYLYTPISEDLPSKMVLLTGPRQVGKTTLAQQLAGHFKQSVYLNYDIAAQQAIIEKRSWPPGSDYVVLDELHQMPDWKRYLKGVFDGRSELKNGQGQPQKQAILVTGSARLDTFRQAGESLAGRYFSYRLMPFSVRELLTHSGDLATPARAVDALLRFSGFPEPLFKGSETHVRRWQAQYFTDLLREDILEFSRIHELRVMRVLIELLRSRTGSPLSFSGLAQDLSVSPTTVRKYIDILQALHIVFLVHPYHRNIARALSKAPKLYFYDWTYLAGGAETLLSAKLENLVACSLLKHVQYQQDVMGNTVGLHYIQTTSGKEVDFVLTDAADRLSSAIEVKQSDGKPSRALQDLAVNHANLEAIQVVYYAQTAYQAGHVSVMPLAAWLAGLSA
jgi:uncharacterized protein